MAAESSKKRGRGRGEAYAPLLGFAADYDAYDRNLFPVKHDQFQGELSQIITQAQAHVSPGPGPCHSSTPSSFLSRS